MKRPSKKITGKIWRVHYADQAVTLIFSKSTFVKEIRSLEVGSDVALEIDDQREAFTRAAHDVGVLK